MQRRFRRCWTNLLLMVLQAYRNTAIRSNTPYARLQDESHIMGLLIWMLLFYRAPAR